MIIPDVSRETSERLRILEKVVLAESKHQNLVSAASINDFKIRHIDDSLQLVPLLPDGPLIDIGSGAGFPGLVLACCRTTLVHLVEPRARRAGFLERAVTALDLTSHTVVHKMAVQRLVAPTAACITARAVASLGQLFEMAIHLAGPDTVWVLPKGRTASVELEAARISWQGEFDLIPSVTDPEAAIVLAKGVRRR
jgi:16S rRNA (guanine527-N7)-methyltransferase